MDGERSQTARGLSCWIQEDGRWRWVVYHQWRRIYEGNEVEMGEIAMQGLGRQLTEVNLERW